MAEHFRVFHSPIEIAGQMGTLVSGLQQFGHTAVGYNTFITYLNYSPNLFHGLLNYVIEEYNKTKYNYDIMHFHLACTLGYDFTDLDQMLAEGKKLIMHHWGNDVRLAEKSKQFSPYLIDPCNPCLDWYMIERLKKISARCKNVIIQDYELYPYVKDYYPNIYILPLAYRVSETVPHFPDPNKKVPLIVHAPTQPGFKGTATIEATLDLLRQHGYAFEYRRIEHLSNAEAIALYKQADIVIDQILVGSYGVLSVENMALGKPVVCYIREDLESTYPSPVPVINANPTNLYQNLIPYLTDASLRFHTGLKSREYALQVHDVPVVIPKLLNIYRMVMTTS